MSWKQAPHAVMQKKSHVPVPVGHNAMGDNEEDTPPAPKVRTRGHRNNGKFFPENIASVQSGNCHHFSGKNVAVPAPKVFQHYQGQVPAERIPCLTSKRES